MDSQEFIKECQNTSKFITDYLENVGKEKISADVTPGFLQPQLEPGIPQKRQPFTKVLEDVKNVIMPGMVHWAHPNFHGYLPSSFAFPSILAEMLMAGTGTMGFTWLAGPAVVELELIMTDWLGKALGLPSHMMHTEDGSQGGGVISSSATEGALTAMLAARLKAVLKLRPKSQETENAQLEMDDAQYMPKLVAYCSNEAHSCIEKASRVAMVDLRILPANEQCQLEPQVLLQAIEKDVAAGLVPCFVVVTLGTSATGAFDDLKAIGDALRNFPDVWLHVNAAYGGNNFICPELREPMDGMERADSFCINANKGLLMNKDTTVLWVRRSVSYCSGLVVDPVYLKHDLTEQCLDLRHWSLWLSRRFRALKIWFTLRLYGVEGLRAHMRNMMKLAKQFADLVRKDERFELCNEVLTPLVCFRLRGPDILNHELLASLNASNKLLMTPAVAGGKFVLRFVVGREGTTPEHIQEMWELIHKAANEIRGPSGHKQFRRLSFTRRVSFMDYRLRPGAGRLCDVGEPVLVPAAIPAKDMESQPEAV